MFNFAYYREYGNRPERGPFNEPPFEVMPYLKDQGYVAKAPQHYFLAPVWRSPYGNALQLPRKLQRSGKITLHFEIAPPSGGWQKNGKLRIQTKEKMGNCQWQARLNGRELSPNADATEPYPNPYPPCLGTPETLRAWIVPPTALQDGTSQIELTLLQGEAQTLVFADLAAW